MLETLKDSKTLEKEKVLLDTFGSSCLVIGVYSEVNNITGVLLIWRLRDFALPWSLRIMVHLDWYINTVHATGM